MRSLTKRLAVIGSVLSTIVFFAVGRVMETRRHLSGLLVGLLLAIAGCGGNTTAPSAQPVASRFQVPASPDPVSALFFPTAPPGQVTMTALVVGQLGEHDRCIWLRKGIGREYLVIWLSGFRLVADGNVAIVDDASGARARIGATVKLFGGEYDATTGDRTRAVEQLIGRPIPSGCRTDSYWLGGLDSAG